MADVQDEPRPGRRRVRVRLLSNRLFAVFGLLTFAAGPGVLIALSSSAVWRMRNVTGRADALVTEVTTVRSMNSVHYCPTLQWQHSGQQQVHRSKYCGGAGEFEKGQRLRVRFASEDPASVVPDELFALYGDAVIGVPLSLVPTALFGAVVLGWRRRRRLEQAGKLRSDGTFEVEVRG
jgi:hypothetical protein